jgi:hypothetical protein
MNWIKIETELHGNLVDVIPLAENHFDELADLAREKSIWEFISIDMSTVEKCYSAFSQALIERKNGTQHPFVIFHKKQNRIIGSTRLMNIEPVHRKLGSFGKQP